MAALTMQPIGTIQAAQERPSAVKKPAEDGADQSNIDSEWVVLGKADIVPADLAAAAAGRHLGFSPLPMMPVWAKWAIGGIVYTVVPFYKRVRQIEDETTENAETAVEVVEHAAEVTEKLAANAADALPEDGSLEKTAEKVECIAEEVDKDAHEVEAVIKKIEVVSDEIDAAAEPVIEELQKEFQQNLTS